MSENKSFQDQVAEAAIKSGGCPPFMQVETDIRSVNCFIDGMPEELTANEKAEAFRSIGEKLGGSELGKLVSVRFASEAWMSTYPKGTDIEKVPAPSKDPERVEVIVISVLHVDTMTCSVSALKMERDDDGKLIALPPIEKTKPTVQGAPPILSAFVEGYIQGQSNPPKEQM